MTTTGLLFDIKKFAIHDGPGIRTTVFVSGCPLTCWWCHNPECQIENGSNGENLVQRKTVSEIIKEVERDIPFYDESGGGVTFSGGEPMLQLPFLTELLLECRKRGIHTAVDTSGYAEERDFSAILENVDMFLYDLKLMDDELHQKTTGVSNKKILSNLEFLAEQGANVRIRIPLIPDITDTNENLEAIGTYLLTLKRRFPADLLPFNIFYKSKYDRLKLDNRLKNMETQSPQRIVDIRETLASSGLDVFV